MVHDQASAGNGLDPGCAVVVQVANLECSHCAGRAAACSRSRIQPKQPARMVGCRRAAGCSGVRASPITVLGDGLPVGARLASIWRDHVDQGGGAAPSSAHRWRQIEKAISRSRRACSWSPPAIAEIARPIRVPRMAARRLRSSGRLRSPRSDGDQGAEDHVTDPT